MDLRVNLSADVKKNISFFESLLYSYKMDKMEETIIESNHFPEWIGLQGIEHTADGDIINLLDFLTDKKFTDCNIIGIWSRPLYIYKSSPIAVFKKISMEEISELREGDPTLLEEGCTEVVFIRFLKDILSYLTIIRQMAEYYVDNATVMANKNIWDAMRDVQLLSI